MIIHPEITVTPDFPTIRFREPKESVDLDKEIPKILHGQGWGCGTYFNVQFLSHDRSELLAFAQYVVTEEKESLHTSDNQFQPMTKTVYGRKATIVGQWWPQESEPRRGRPRKTEAA